MFRRPLWIYAALVGSWFVPFLGIISYFAFQQIGVLWFYCGLPIAIVVLPVWFVFCLRRGLRIWPPPIRSSNARLSG